MEAYKTDNNTKQIIASKINSQTASQFIKYNSHYQQAKRNFLKAKGLVNFKIEGYKDKHIRHFIQQISVKDQNYRLQINEFNEILKELVDLFRRLKQKIILQASQEDSEYNRILGENNFLFKERGRQKRFQAYSTIERNVSLDLFALISKRNFEYDCFEYEFKLSYFIPNKTIQDICRIQQSNVVYRSTKSIWEQYYHFIGQTREMSFFDPLVDLLFLIHLKRRQSATFKVRISKGAYLQPQEFKKRFKMPPRKSFINQEEFQFKFCEIVILQLKFQQIKSSKPNEQIVLKRKVQKIFDQRQKTRQCLQLRKLLFLSGLSFRSVVEWWNYTISKNERQPSQQQIIQALQHYNWQFLEQGANNYNKKFSLQPKTTTPNIKMYIDQQISDRIFCKMALERTMKVTNFLAIQNSIMNEADQKEPLYIRHFTYSYSYCSKQNQKNADNKDQLHIEAVFTLLQVLLKIALSFLLIWKKGLTKILFGNCYHLLSTSIIKDIPLGPLFRNLVLAFLVFKTNLFVGYYIFSKREQNPLWQSIICPQTTFCISSSTAILRSI